MHPFDRVVEERLQRAEEAGQLRGLPGSGRPLELEDLRGVPDELRSSYLLLKSNGFVPPELEARKQWLRLEDLLRTCRNEPGRARLLAGVANHRAGNADAARRAFEAATRYEATREDARRWLAHVDVQDGSGG